MQRSIFLGQIFNQINTKRRFQATDNLYRSSIMSQITIVDDVLNFTELNASMQHAAERSNSSEDRGNNGNYGGNDESAAKSLNEEEQRVVHELTSILISGHLPQ
jgi:hypothetical protein